MRVCEFSLAVSDEGAVVLEDGRPMAFERVVRELAAGRQALQSLVDRQHMVEDLVATMQAALIAACGQGNAESGLMWVERKLLDERRLPKKGDPHTDSALRWYHANRPRVDVEKCRSLVGRVAALVNYSGYGFDRPVLGMVGSECCDAPGRYILLFGDGSYVDVASKDLIDLRLTALERRRIFQD